MINRKFTYIFLFVFLFSVSEFAISESVGLKELKISWRLELPTVIRIAFYRNPKIKAAYNQWNASIEKLPQVTSLPDPMIM